MGANLPAPDDRMEAVDTYEAPLHGWTCFHCGESVVAWVPWRKGASPRQLLSESDLDFGA